MPPVVKKQVTGLNRFRQPALPNILERIAPIGFSDDDGIKMLIYGRSGTGKTTLWSSFPAPILSVICSGSDKPGELRSVDTPANRVRIKHVVLNHSDELPTLSSYLASGESPYRTVIIDHLSAMQDKMMAEILGIEKMPEQKTWGTATQDTWQRMGAAMKEYLRAFLSLPVNTIMIAQERAFTPKEGDTYAEDVMQPFVGPNLIPSVSSWLCPAVDYIVQTFIRQRMEEREMPGVGGKKIRRMMPVRGVVDYCIRTGPHDAFHTKFRCPKDEVKRIPECIVDPDYEKVIGLIRGLHTAA